MTVAKKTSAEKAERKVFKVVSPIESGLDRYEPGETIELTQEEADAIPWAVEESVANAEP